MPPRRLPLLALIVVVALIAAGCGDSAPPFDGGGPPAPQRDGGARTDGGTVDGGITTVTEAEAVDARTNDSPDTAVAVSFGDIVSGTIGTFDPVDALDDIDFYRFTVAAPTMLRVTVSARSAGDYQAFAVVRGPGDYVDRLVLPSANLATATRQAFLPEAGEYFLIVADLRNTDVEPAGVGGAATTYELRITTEPFNPTPVVLPVSAQAGTVADDGAVPVFSFTTVAGQGYRAQTRADRLSPASSVDTLLYLMDATGASPTALASNDDLSSLTFDSLVNALPGNAGTHWVVLDYHAIDGPTRTYELDIQQFDPAAELEPNDPLDVANPIPGVGSTISGAIEARSGEFDLDYFALEATAGTYYEIVVTKPGGSNADFRPQLDFVDPEGYITFENPNRTGSPVPATVRLEAYAFESGTHWIRVGDARNLEGLGPFGGADYTYSLQVNAITRTVHDLNPGGGFPVSTGSSPSAPAVGSIHAKIDQSGKTAWYRFQIPAGTVKLGYLELDLRSVGGQDGIELNPYLTLLGSDGVTFLAAGNVLTIRDIALAPGTYTLSVSDLDGRFSASHHAFQLRVAAASDLAAATDDGTHTSTQNALAIGTNAAVTATLVEDSAHWFALGALTAGTKLTAFTEPGAAGFSVDTVLTLLRSDGTTVVAEDDDSGLEYFSRFEGVVIPVDDQYFLRVTGYDEVESGEYLLVVYGGGCPSPASADAGVKYGDLYINEVLAAPAPGGDANGDGVDGTDANDEFVEIVNTSATPKDLSGLVIRDAQGPRYRAACGTVLPAGAALSVFGACAGGGICPSVGVANADVEDPTATSSTAGLSLDNASDLVALIATDGTILDRVAWGVAAAANHAWVRGSGAVCDAKPSAPGSVTDQTSLVLHNACAGSTCTTPPCYSPGKQANGTDFSPPPPAAGNTCANAIALPTEMTFDSRASGITDSYQPVTGASAACSGLDGASTYTGHDVAFSIAIPAGQTLTVTVTPTSDWDPAIAVVTDCSMAGPSCVASADVGFDGAAETAVYPNPDLVNPKTVFVIVDAWDASSQGTFTISATTQ